MEKVLANIKTLVITFWYSFTSISNISDVDARLKDNCHGEADTCIVFHSYQMQPIYWSDSELLWHWCSPIVILLFSWVVQ